MNRARPASAGWRLRPDPVRDRHFVPSPAEATVFGTVKCIVHDPQHQPVAGTMVRVSAQHADWNRSAVTDGSGAVTFVGVPIGDYRVEASASGFETTRQAITVISDAVLVVDLRLHLAPVSEEVTVSANPERVYTASVTPTTLVDRKDISITPGAGRTNGVEVITSFVPGSYVTHNQLHLRGGHQVSWLVDGVPVPNTNIASNVGPQFDPKDADYIEVHRGGYSAEYGDRTYAVFNVVPRTGFERENEAEVVLSAGNFGQTNDQVSAGGHTQRFAYYASLTGNSSSLGLQTPVPRASHDRETGLGGFATLIFNATRASQVRLVSSIRHDVYQVPSDPEVRAAEAAAVEREFDGFVNLSWVRAFDSGVLLTVSPFYHANSTKLDGGAPGICRVRHRPSCLPVSRRAGDFGCDAGVASAATRVLRIQPARRPGVERGVQ